MSDWRGDYAKYPVPSPAPVYWGTPCPHHRGVAVKRDDCEACRWIAGLPAPEAARGRG